MTPDPFPRTYRIDLKYVGTPFVGWQSQSGGGSVQDHLEKALSTVLRRDVAVVGAGRTDSGVHAEHQVATFCHDTVLSDADLKNLQRGLDALLPQEIGITTVTAVAKDFHPIRSSRGKVYRYRLWRSEGRDPFLEPFVWRVWPSLDVEQMKRGGAYFVGSHDFTSYCATDSSARTKVRDLTDVQVEEKGPVIEVWCLGTGFLKQMVRTIVGTLVEVGMGRRSADSIPETLTARDRSVAGQTAPAHGLTLVRVCYEPPGGLREVMTPSGVDLGGSQAK